MPTNTVLDVWNFTSSLTTELEVDIEGRPYEAFWFPLAPGENEIVVTDGSVNIVRNPVYW